MTEERNTRLRVESNHEMVCLLRVTEEIEQGRNGSIIRLVDSIIAHAHAARASDIHLDPIADALLVRLRIDGVLTDVHTLPLLLHAEIITRLKILCGLRTDEHQAAQDGRFQLEIATQIIDVRVSIVPLYYGENAVLRLLVGETELSTLNKLGFSAVQQEKISAALRKPYGMILATGPTGSGKTTTLYTLIGLLKTHDTSIITIEDPIEYAISGVNQIQVNSRTGLTFANGLRSMLRQDPNTIMVGEIRDIETAALSVNIALTGHVILSTLHTNDAATTLPRLLDMKVEPYLIASTVNMVIAQRLVRLLCPDCKKEKILTRLEIAQFGHSSSLSLTVGMVVYSAVGCISCNGSGYRGRIGVHEVMVMTQSLREMILRQVDAATLRSLAIAEGMVPLVDDGLSKVLSGLTSIEEVLKIHYE